MTEDEVRMTEDEVRFWWARVANSPKRREDDVERHANTLDLVIATHADMYGISRLWDLCETFHVRQPLMPHPSIPEAWCCRLRFE